jgi:hypothetical protein
MKTEKRCERCGAVVVLVKTGKEQHTWVTDTKRKTWKCLPTSAFPVRSHVVKTDQS